MRDLLHRRGVALVLAVLGLTFVVPCVVPWLAPPAAHAQRIKFKLKVRPPAAPGETADKTEKGKLSQPTFLAVVEGAAEGLAQDKFTLKQDLAKAPVTVKADKVRTFKETDEPMYMVVLIQGDTQWMGNEQYFDPSAGEDGETLREGAFTAAKEALGKLVDAGPAATSQAALVIYAGGTAIVKREMGPIADLAGALGEQQEYTEVSSPILIGLDQAANILGGFQGRRILVLMGDGTGQSVNFDAGLKERIDRLKGMEVETFTIFFEPIPSDDQPGVPTMEALGKTGDFKKAELKNNLPTLAESFAKKINAVYYVTFPSCTEAQPPVCMTHDGKEYDFVLSVAEQEQEPVPLQTVVWDAPKPPQESSLWWLWLLLVLLVIVVVIVIVVKMSKREEIVQPPMPEPMDMPPIQAPPPAPLKTMMIGVGGQEGGMPVVGWIVPLSGPNQFQTFKLLQGVTKIGSGGSSDIVIGDQFMSAEHCEIHMSPVGFTLKDGGSTNGTQVNSGRVNTHDLVDNDMITMGKTNFKFKSIN